MTPVLALTLLVSIAPAWSDDVPLALPHSTPAPAPPSRSTSPAASQPGAAMSAELLAAVRSYKANRLVVRPVTTYQGGQTMIMGGPSWGWGGPGRWGGGWGYGGWGMSSAYVTAPNRVDSWAVYRGPERLDVPAYYRAVGREDAARDVERRIRKNRGWSAGLITTGVVGAVATIGGLVAMDFAQSEADLATAGWVTLGGLTAGVTGLLAASGPTNRARNLRQWPRLTMALQDAQTETAAHNERLRIGLGVPPERAHEIELGDD